MKKDTRTVLITFTSIILILFMGSMSYFERVYADETANAVASQKVASFLAFERERKELARIQEAERQAEIARQEAVALAIKQAEAQAQQVAYVPPVPVYVPPPAPVVVTPPAPKPVVVKPSRQTRAS